MQGRIYRAIFVAVILVSAAIDLSAQTDYDTSPQAQTGQQVYGSYFGTNIDSVGLYNGNLSLSIPLFSLPGRELPYGLTLTYNSQKWEQMDCSGSPCGLYTGGWQKSNLFGSAPSFWLGSDTSCSYSRYNVFWIDGSGAKHRYATSCTSSQPSGWDNLTLNTLDSDGSTFSTGNYESYGSAPAQINFKNGNVRYFRDHGATSPSYDYASPNGNYFVNNTSNNSIVYVSGLPAQDTLGRSVTYSGWNGSYESYTVKDSNGISQTYKLYWNWNTFIDPWSQVYVSGFQLMSIVLPNGKSYSFQYGNQSQGFLTQVTLPSGAYIKYLYPASPNDINPCYDQVLERHVSPDGMAGSEQVWTYSGRFYSGYGCTPNANASTVTVTSPVGDKILHTFNSQGLETDTQWQNASGTVLKEITSTWSQLDVESNYQPNTPQTNTIVTYMDGTLLSTRTITYDGNMNVTQEVLTDAATLPGSVHTEKDFTYTTISGNYEQPASETLTATDPVTGNFILQGKTTYAYDENSTLTARSGVPNQNGNSSPTGRGNLTSVTKYINSGTSITEHMKYDSVGNIVQKLDGLGNATNIDFTDNFCTLISGTCTNTSPFQNTSYQAAYAYPTRVTNALSQSTTTKYDYYTGLPTVALDLRGNSTQTTYDLLNRAKTITEPNGKATSYTYDDTNLCTTKTVTVDSMNSGTQRSYFDGLYRVIKTGTADPDPAGYIFVDTQYDSKGRKTKVSNPYRYSGNWACPLTAASGSDMTTTTYDALDRATQVQAPDSSTVQYAYNYNQTTVTDQAGNQRRYTYNAAGQMTKVEEPNPTLSNPLVTTYSYYSFGPLYQSNQSSQIRTFVNDWLGRQTSQTIPESGTTTFSYDNASRLSSKTDARSITTTFSYDNANRPTGKSYNDGVTPSVSWGYDANGDTGLKTSMTDTLGSVAYTYDNMNRLSQESRTLTSIGTFNTSYGYNLKGDLTTMTYPSGRTVNFNYATGGGCCNSRLASVVDQTTSVAINGTMNYDAAGDLLNNILGNGVVENYTYDNYRLQQKTITATIGSTALMNFTYNYGTSSTNTGRVLSRTDAIQPEHSASYSYDPIYRLSGVVSGDSTSSWGIAWTFDTWGNRLSQTALGITTGPLRTYTQTYVNTSGNQMPYFTNTNQMSGISYDAAGNQLGDGALPVPTTYTFNAENQMITSNGPGGTASYTYDGDGRRMKKSVTISSVTETTYFFYGPGGIISEFTTSSAIATATAAASTDKCIYHTTDKLGSAVLVMNAAGAVIENNRTLPYGEMWLPSDNGQASTNDKKFTTYQRDAESGLDYAINRYDASATGRFMSLDRGKMQLYAPTTLNRYVYSTNDPINGSDPTGNYTCPGCPPPPPPPESESGLPLWSPILPEPPPQRSLGNDGPKDPCYTPPMPKTASLSALSQNIAAAQARSGAGLGATGLLSYTSNLSWFAYESVTAWNYKAGGGGPAGEVFGNFNYGAVGAALGLSTSQILAGAGWYQAYSDAKGGSSGLSNTDIFKLVAGMVKIFTDVGTGAMAKWDNPDDQANILKGIDYYQEKYVLKSCQ